MAHHQKSLLLSVLAAASLICSAGLSRADSLLPLQVTDEQTAPQGNDPPGPDEPGLAVPAPNDKGKGVIIPPPTGDEEIHTTVPNPNAGHDKEVLPPPGTPENAPNIDPR